MDERSRKNKLTMIAPAYYQIKVQGYLEENWSDRLGGLKITNLGSEAEVIITQLSGELLDQAALLGMLNALYNMHYPLLSVVCLDKTPDSL